MGALQYSQIVKTTQMSYHTQHCSKNLDGLCHFGTALKKTGLAQRGFYKISF